MVFKRGGEKNNTNVFKHYNDPLFIFEPGG